MTFNLTVLGENMWADWGAKTYKARLPKLAATRKTVGAELVLGCETGNYDDGAALSRAYGFGGLRSLPTNRGAYVLHSNNDVRISHSIHFPPTLFRVVDEDWMNTLKSSTHNGATWALLEHRNTKDLFYAAVMHGVPWPIGPNNVRKWDLERESQVGAMLRTLNSMREATAKEYDRDVIPAIIGEDFNGARTDPYDGPGKAMARYGFVDAHSVARKLLPAGSAGKRALIDRIGVTKAGVQVIKHTIIPTKGGSDHPYAVAANVELTNERK